MYNGLCQTPRATKAGWVDCVCVFEFVYVLQQQPSVLEKLCTLGNKGLRSAKWRLEWRPLYIGLRENLEMMLIAGNKEAFNFRVFDYRAIFVLGNFACLLFQGSWDYLN